MLFTKKVRFSINEKQQKEDIPDENGNVLVKVNLRYPEIKCSKKDVLFGFCSKLYPKMANGFFDYAKKDLKQIAQKVRNENAESFLPFSALMKWENLFIDERFLCILTDISVSDGKNVPNLERRIEVWEREYGTKCRFSYFFKNDAKKVIQNEVLDDENRKSFDKELFALTKDGFEFHVKQKHSYRTYLIPFSFLKEKELLKVDF